MKYRKIPVEIEAVRYADGGIDELSEWIQTAFEDGKLAWDIGSQLYVMTLEGGMHVSDGDYIIRGVQGEIYPCKPDIFEQTYEAVKENRSEQTSS